MRQWRLIYDNHTSGLRNMGVDESIMRAVAAGDAPPTLRLYGWSPPCMSIGYAQKVRDLDLDRITSRGWEVVRRPTGGRAILHVDELTYSVAMPLDEPIAQGSIVDSYRRISGALATGLTALGVSTQAERRTERGGSSAVCFETPSHYEITVDGRKLIGSAQMRRKDTLLQHGSIPLTGDLARICDGLAYPDEAARQAAKGVVHERALTLADALGQEVSWQVAAEAVVDGFTQTFDIVFTEGQLSVSEDDTAARLVREIYGSLERPKRRD